MKKILGNIIFGVYAIIAVLVTICLLSYNDYKVSEFGNNSIIIIDSNKLEPDFMEGDLVIVNKEDKIDIGDNIFFYNTYTRDIEITLGKVTEMEKVSEKETTYTINDSLKLSSEYVVGSAKTSDKYGKIGKILSVLESKWGFLFLIVFPSLIAFIYEIYIIAIEIKDRKKEEIKE